MKRNNHRSCFDCIAYSFMQDAGICALGFRVNVSKRDQAAINRMQETGITAVDLEYERSVGYKDGRETPFFYSSCYAALGLALHSEKGFDVE